MCLQVLELHKRLRRSFIGQREFFDGDSPGKQIEIHILNSDVPAGRGPDLRAGDALDDVRKDGERDDAHDDRKKPEREDDPRAAVHSTVHTTS